MNSKFRDLESTIQLYVLGRMSEATATEFEEYYLARPDVIEQIDLAQEIHLGLEFNSKRDERQDVTETRTGNPSLVSWLMDWMRVPVPAYSVAFLAVIAIMLTLTAPQLLNRSQEIELLHFSTVAVRGQSQLPSIDLSAVKGDAAVLIKIRKAQYPYYRLKLLGPENAELIWKSEPFQISALRDHMVVIPKNTSRSTAVIEVVGIDSNSNESAVDFCHYSELCNPVIN